MGSSELRARGARTQAYAALRQARTEARFDAMLDAAEKFLSQRLLGRDARVAEVEALYSEALVRWFRPGVGYVNPEEFVPIAERSGLIRPLTSVVLDQAVAFAAAHQDAELPFAVSVNISSESSLCRAHDRPVKTSSSR